MAKSKWKDPSLDQTGRSYPTPGLGGGRAKAGTGSANGEPLYKQAKQADADFKSTTKNAQRHQRH